MAASSALENATATKWSTRKEGYEQLEKLMRCAESNADPLFDSVGTSRKSPQPGRSRCVERAFPLTVLVPAALAQATC